MKGTTLFVAVIFIISDALGSVKGIVEKSDDEFPLERVVQNLSSQMILLQSKVTALENTLTQLKAAESQRAVFTASIRDPNIRAAPGHIIPFAHVITNAGNAYDTITSAFRAPSDGQYFFFVSVDVSADYKALEIYVNGRAVIIGHNDAGDHHIFAGGAITLKAGDEVIVRHRNGAVGSVDGGPEAIFCGFKI